MKIALAEGEDYYYNEQGYMVLTEKYHLDRGTCCGNGCLHCPFDYDRVPETRRQQLLEERESRNRTETKD